MDKKQVVHSYVQLFNRVDRLGANLTNLIAVIVYGISKTFAIDANERKLKYRSSPFVHSLLDCIDQHNQAKNFETLQGMRFVNLMHRDWCFVMTRSVQAVQQDLVSYFKSQTNIRQAFLDRTKKFAVPFDINKTIVVHLRLDDVSRKSDYDGKECSLYYKQKIEQGEICGVVGYDRMNHQAPLSKEKLQTQIQKAQEKYPDWKVVIVTSPGSISPFPSYSCISSSDPNYDLYLLCQAKVVILSRSTFALAALFFGDHSDVYLPLWGHAVACGFYTKYDQCKYNYFF
jgi:hypothetical protein